MSSPATETSPRPEGGSGDYGGSFPSLEAEKQANPSPAKLRSCVVCRSRKVRCDKQSPCSNCRRGNVACVFPSVDRPPRWARRRLELAAQNAAAAAAAEARPSQASGSATDQVMERLRHLENLVKTLSGQLEQAQAQAQTSAGSSTGDSPGSSSTHDSDAYQQKPPSSIQSQFGRLVLNDSNRSRYISSGFWSRVNDEIDDIKAEAQHLDEAHVDTSEDEAHPGTTPSSHELERPPADRHAFLFRHNLSSPGPDMRDLRPLPSQVPFLLDIFSENVNFVMQIVHMPTVRKMVRHLRYSDGQLTPANEALMFSIYYAAITSMEEDEVLDNFRSTKSELNLKYRLGLEYALARADFLNVPDLVLVQAFAIFLFLVRRYDSPRFVWMMTGLVIRMAQSLGLQRDGTHFKDLTPYEIEMRRRVWYGLCALDVRASEDQGTDFTIQHGSFDTKLPLNINHDDLDVDTKELPAEREGLTDMTAGLYSMEVSNISRQMMVPGIEYEEQNRLVEKIYATLDRRVLRFPHDSTPFGKLLHWTLIVVTRVMCGKLKLFIHLPVLFSSPGEHFSDEVRNKLLVAAIEVAELNHALFSEKACRPWRWIFQTYSHWHAVVYLLLDMCRRPWSPIVERAWIALHSPWLIPARSKFDKDLQTWVPLRKLMLKARLRRDTELERLRKDPITAQQLEMDDRRLPLPATDGTTSPDRVADIFREVWRRLVGLSSHNPDDSTRTPAQPVDESQTPQSAAKYATSSGVFPATTGDFVNPYPATTYDYMSNQVPVHTSMSLEQPPAGYDPGIYNLSQPSTDWPTASSDNSGLLGWLLADTEPNANIFPHVGAEMNMDFDLDTAMDWHGWVESARGMEMDAHTSASRQDM
ncbi:hypothetical protein F5Y17DRAFT_187706 [Xylariaceae sp. FL0594]|nr:hypothetical protein F5Y17DRAFT_187706 [Xylariaceae sp. FL0594]